jgi:hypothetical protein
MVVRGADSSLLVILLSMQYMHIYDLFIVLNDQAFASLRMSQLQRFSLLSDFSMFPICLFSCLPLHIASKRWKDINWHVSFIIKF